MRLLNKIFPLNGVGDLELYLGGDIEVSDIDDKPTHTFSAHTCIKKASEKIQKLFETTLKNYETPLDGGYYTYVDNYNILIGDEVSM